MRAHIRARRPQPATILALVALFVALGGSAVAATLVTGKQIKNRSVTGKDIKKRSLATNHLSKKAVNALKGAKGETGAQGVQGVQGPRGVVTPESATADSVNLPPGNEDTSIVSKTAPPGTYVVTGKAYMFSPDVARIGCSLNSGADTVDNIQWDAPAAGLRNPMMLTAVVAVPTGGNLEINCAKQTGAGAGSISQAKLIAIPVG